MRHVSKVFSNGTLALKDMSLDVERGEFISLLGPSGCGKSTALRIIAGLGAASSGSIDWPTSNLNSKGIPQGDIGFVFQEPTLMPWSTVFDCGGDGGFHRPGVKCQVIGPHPEDRSAAGV